MANRLIPWLFSLLCFGLSANVAAHTYFFSISEISVNEKNQSLEVIHQITAHDIENAIAEKQQIHFSTAHPDYESIIEAYIEQHFKIGYNGKVLPLTWVGLELNKSHVIIYQSLEKQNFLAGLVVKNQILVDTYANQINTVNYQDAAISGSLTFTATLQIMKIAGN